eukprot:CAMPEP_0177655170 /NCGR_PEP_ID=MMETSP0447-20121125/14798_1 /TAXON_ID=0 /ORGANISM="Stygamoeba regulata, Strain BSH-02190019" /LENGTH=178 /DNA_ID=CAMNT_0019159019 /DNA_START=58 /DNA_END=590 /DNA_ORIENTATION=+
MASQTLISRCASFSRIARKNCLTLNSTARLGACTLNAPRINTQRPGSAVASLSLGPRTCNPRMWNQPQRRRYCTSLPAYDELLMPALSPTMEKGNIVAWKKKEGDEISAGDVLAEIETDKAVMAFEASDDGFLAKVLVPEQTEGVAVGSLIAIMVSDKADVAAFKDFKAPSAAGKPAA